MSRDFDLHLLPGVARGLRKIVGDDPEELKLLAKAIKRARFRSSVQLFADLSPLSIVTRNIGIESLGQTFRRQHRISNRTLRLAARQMAFGALPDEVREEFAQFCHLMYLGFQGRFLNRHPSEEPEQFLERPRKTWINLTRLIVRLKSTLYIQPPVREFPDDFPAEAKERLEEVYGDLYNLTLLFADRLTRLLGTVSIRPMIDPESPGGVRLWVFLNHQIRIIPDPDKPWKPKAVIERHDPFNPAGRIVIWTDKTELEITAGMKFSGRSHGLGRIPHTIVRDELSFQSFFVEGLGRSLCEQNGVINDKLSDLNEVVQMQGFSVPQIFNPTEDEIVIGPRRALVFETDPQQAAAGIKQGVEFARPNSPLGEIREDIEGDIRNLFRVHRVPDAAIGIALGRSLSGLAIRAMMAPLTEENEERGKLWMPAEHDLADNILRTLNEHDENFSYTPDPEKPIEFSIEYRPPRLPVSIEEELAQNEFDLAHGITTPAQIMRRRNPTRFTTPEEALKQWEKNLAELAEAPTPTAEALEEAWEDDETLVARLLRRYGTHEDADALAEILDATADRGNGADQ